VRCCFKVLPSSEPPAPAVALVSKNAIVAVIVPVNYTGSTTSGFLEVANVDINHA
jgi:hypothetical protein